MVRVTNPKTTILELKNQNRKKITVAIVCHLIGSWSPSAELHWRWWQTAGHFGMAIFILTRISVPWVDRAGTKVTWRHTVCPIERWQPQWWHTGGTSTAWANAAAAWSCSRINRETIVGCSEKICCRTVGGWKTRIVLNGYCCVGISIIMSEDILEFGEIQFYLWVSFCWFCGENTIPKLCIHAWGIRYIWKQAILGHFIECNFDS